MQHDIPLVRNPAFCKKCEAVETSEADVLREKIYALRGLRWTEGPHDLHLQRQIMGREVVVAVTDGRIDFGPWEQIFYGEFDGGRRERVLVKSIGE